MAVKRPWIEGLRPVPGSWKLMALRWLLFVVAALPSLAGAMGGIGENVANRPYFAEAPDPLPMLPLMRLIDHLPGSIWALTALAAVIAWLGSLLLTACAVTLFGNVDGGRPRVWRTVLRAGDRSLWAYLRIALLALVLGLVGARVISMIGDRLSDYGAHALWTMRARYLLAVGRGLATACWLALVGVFAWWCRVIVVADERRRVRRLLTIVPRLWKRRPFGALAVHYLLALGALVAGAAFLFAWRQSSATAPGWAMAWLVVLGGLSFLWHWRLRAGRLLWSRPDLLDLRAIPDAPWRLPGRLLSRLRRPVPAPPPAPHPTPVATEPRGRRPDPAASRRGRAPA